MTKLSLENHTRIPRATGLVLSPDGGRLVLTADVLSPDSTRFISSLWEVAADGSAPPRRLTFSDQGDSRPAFLPDGSLVFSSARRDPTRRKDEAEGGIWLLPASGGEARRLVSVGGGVRGLAAARDADTVVLRAQLFPGTEGIAGDAEKARRRLEAGTSAILYDTFPIRWWDRDLGPRWSRLLRLSGVAGAGCPEAEELTPDAVDNLDTNAYDEDCAFCVAPDGMTVVSPWSRALGRGRRAFDLVAIRDGARRTVAGAEYGFSSPDIAPDGRHVVALAHQDGTPGRARRVQLWLGDLESGEGGVVAADFALWPAEPRWAADSSAVYFAADEAMQRPIFRYDVADGRITRLTDAGSFRAICPSPDGRGVYALRSSWSTPLEVVRVDTAGTVTSLPTPGLPLELRSSVTPVVATADDGTPLRAWLVLPSPDAVAQPAPLVLWIHGGPNSSWNSWSWRWCPHLLAERGYAVLLPDPALSTGYGADFIERAWGVWGDRVMSDLFTVLDDVLRRPEIDATRVAAMGGSFGGYMANWLAGHSHRFLAIVTHAGLWSLEQFRGTTDEPNWWEDEFGSLDEHPGAYAAASPDRAMASIRTPMLVIHGGHDFRVPVSEALRLWLDLQRHDVPSQYLYFPDENHWILKPGNARVWYETVLAFLDHHVLGKPLVRPELL
ncbi:MAG: alpha/beta fold hydrolase [Candidatus Dormiibacterota bacterium]